MLILTVVTGPDKGAVFRLAGDKAHRIGRRHGSVPLNDKGTSSRHAEIAHVNGLWTVTDLGSSNGTYVNQHRIGEPTVIEDGGRIQVGRTMLVFTVVDDADLEQHDDEMHESGSHTTLHAALAAQERNQQLLTEVRDLLAARSGDSTDERTHTGESELAAGVGHEQVAELVRQVLDRIGHLKPAPPAKPEPDPRLDDVLDQLRHMSKREHVVAPPPPPAPPVDLSPVLDELTKLRESQPKPAPPAPAVDLRPVLEAIDQVAERTAKAAASAAPAAPITPAPPVDLSPVLDELTRLREAQPKSVPPVDLTPIIERLDKLAAARTEPAKPVDLSPVLDELAKLREATNKPAPPAPPVPTIDFNPVLDAIAALTARKPEPPTVDLSPVLDAIAKRDAAEPTPDTHELKAKLDELLAAAKSTADAGASSAAVRNAMPTAIAELRKTIDALPAKLDPSAALHRVLDRIDAAADPRQLADLRNSIEQLGDRLDRGDELKRLAAAIERANARAAAAPPPTEPAPAPVDPTPKLDALHEAVAALRDRLDAFAAAKPSDQPDRTAELRDKLDQLLDIATAPPAAPAASNQPDPAMAIKLDELRDAVASLSDRAPAASTDDPLARRIIERLDDLASREPAPVPAGPAIDLSALEHKLDAVIDVLAAMPQATGNAPDLSDAAIAELNARLEVIYEAIQSRPAAAPSATAGAATSGEIDTLIELVQSEGANANAEAALNKVLAKLDALSAPTPTVDHELLERLELAARKLEKLPDIDLGPALAISDQIEPMMRRVHDHIVASEPVDLTAFERRVAELTETVRDSVNRSDRPLLEQILVEVRKPAEQLDADKLELILERVARIQDTRELEPIVRQMQESLNVSSNEKIVALLRQLIEHVQKMPSKFDGRDTLGNIFESLRRLEQQQDQQGAAIRRLIASVADAESNLAAAPAPPRPALAAPVPSIRTRSDADAEHAIEELIAGADPRAGRTSRRSLWLTLVLVAMVPLAIAGVVLLWGEIDRGFDLIRKDRTPVQQPDSINRPADDTVEAPDSAVTKR